MAAALIGVMAFVTPGPSAAPEREPVAVASGLDRFASRTAKDWVSQAHYVAVATVTDERELLPSEQELALGEGLIGRDVTLKIDRVVWRTPGGQPAELPETVVLNGAGWTFSAENPRAELTLFNQSRLEMGHRYVVAMTLYCGQEDDGTTPYQWAVLGEHAVIPFDEDTLGAGEFEGSVRSMAEVRATIEASGVGSLRQAMLGLRPADISAALERVPAPTVKSATPNCSGS